MSRISLFPSSVCVSCLRFLPNLKAVQAGLGGYKANYLSSESQMKFKYMVLGHLWISNAGYTTGPFLFGSLVVSVWSGFKRSHL